MNWESETERNRHIAWLRVVFFLTKTNHFVANYWDCSFVPIVNEGKEYGENESSIPRRETIKWSGQCDVKRREKLNANNFICIP